MQSRKSMSLPSDLYEVFELDEGMRPGICFENLTDNEVINIYSHIKDHCGELSAECTVWSNKLENDVEIRSFPNPAIEVVSGEVCSFCHYLPDYSSNGISVGNVSIYIFPDSIEIFYDVRDIRSKKEIENILLFIKEINSLCPRCTPFFAEENRTRREEKYQLLLTEFVNE